MVEIFWMPPSPESSPMRLQSGIGSKGCAGSALHYTDVAGLIGICSSGSLWATNLHFMNDARELPHAWKLMHDALAEAKTQARLPAQLDSSRRSSEGPQPKEPDIRISTRCRSVPTVTF